MPAELEPPKTPNLSPRKRCGGQGEDDSCSPRKKQSSPSKKAQLPTSLAEAAEEDRMLFRMKDEEGRGWNEIRDAWQEMTGTDVTVNAVKKRHQRLKASFTVFNDEDVPRLLEAIEQDGKDRWNRIAKAIVGAGGQSYNAVTIQKKMKELGHA
ncbi:hypothetical protein KEM56_001232 [Ascosphaera pollenicola]|nr:hypothetical protein KEM56_001232 [Ascosphaera pollenicola]